MRRDFLVDENSASNVLIMGSCYPFLGTLSTSSFLVIKISVKIGQQFFCLDR